VVSAASIFQMNGVIFHRADENPEASGMVPVGLAA